MPRDLERDPTGHISGGRGHPSEESIGVTGLYMDKSGNSPGIFLKICAPGAHPYCVRTCRVEPSPWNSEISDTGGKPSLQSQG